MNDVPPTTRNQNARLDFDEHSSRIFTYSLLSLFRVISKWVSDDPRLLSTLSLYHTVEFPIWGSIVEGVGGGLNRLVPFEYVARKSTSTEGIYFWLTLFHAISSTTRGESRKNAPQLVDHSACVFCCWSAAVLINDASEGNVCDRKFQDPSIGRRIFYFHCLFEENAQTVALFNATIYLWGEDAIGNEVTGAHLMDTEPNIVTLLVYVVLHHPPANERFVSVNSICALDLCDLKNFVLFFYPNWLTVNFHISIVNVGVSLQIENSPLNFNSIMRWLPVFRSLLRCCSFYTLLIYD